MRNEKVELVKDGISIFVLPHQVKSKTVSGWKPAKQTTAETTLKKEVKKDG